MNVKLTQYKRTLQASWISISLLLLSGCHPGANLGIPSETGTPTPGRVPGHWRVLGIYNEDQSIMTAGFFDEQFVVTGGVMGQMAYSSDGARTWLQTSAASVCRYGMDIVSPQVIWTCGGGTHVRKSVDGGRTWLVLAAFGEPRSIRGPVIP